MYRPGVTLSLCLLACAAVVATLTPDHAATSPQLRAVVAPTNAGPSITYAAANGKYVKAMPRNGILNITLVLRGRHEDQIPQLIQSQVSRGSPYFHRWMTPTQYGAYFGADAQSVASTVATLRSSGFSVTNVDPDARFIHVKARVGAVQAVFGTPIDIRTDGRQTYYANRYEPRIPRNLPIVEDIGGLDSYDQTASGPRAISWGFPKRPQHGHEPALGPNPHATMGTQFAFGPADVDAAYDVGSVRSAGLTGSGVTIAVLLVRQALQSDVINFDNFFGIPNVTLNETFLNGTCSSPCPMPTGQSDKNESAIDTEWAHAAAPGAAIDSISVGDRLATSQLLGLEYIVNVLGGSAQIVSMSTALCETGYPRFITDGVEAAVAQGTLEGQTFFAASGDTGADGCPNLNDERQDTLQLVNLPAADPYVVGVGGTSMNVPILLGNVTGYGQEFALNDSGCFSTGNPTPPPGMNASGGGASRTISKPTWQVGKTPADGMRDVPDVALYADGWSQTGFPATCPLAAGYWVSVGGAFARLDGTSVATPIWAGYFALIEQKLNGRLGNVLPALYNLRNTAAFHQITTGDNHWYNVPGFSEASGYNQVTGLGTPDLAQLVEAYAGLPIPTPTPTVFPTPGPHPTTTPSVFPTARAFIPDAGLPGTGDAGDVEVYDATIGGTIGQLIQTVSGLSAPVDLTFNSAGSTVYVVELGGRIDTINTSTTPYTLTLGAFNSQAFRAGGIALKSSRLWVTDPPNATLHSIPTGGGSPLTIGVGNGAGSVAANPSTTFVYVANVGDDTISIVNTSTDAVVQTIPVGQVPSRLAVTPNGKTLVVANSGDGTVTAINVSTTPATVIGTVYVAGEPVAIAISKNNKIAYVANLFCPLSPSVCNPDGHTVNGTVELVSLTTTPMKNHCCIVVGQMPEALSFEPIGRYLWVVDAGSNAVTVIDSFDNSIFGTFTTAPTTLDEWATMGSFAHAVP